MIDVKGPDGRSRRAGLGTAGVDVRWPHRGRASPALCSSIPGLGGGDPRGAASLLRQPPPTPAHEGVAGASLRLLQATPATDLPP